MRRICQEFCKKKFLSLQMLTGEGKRAILPLSSKGAAGVVVILPVALFLCAFVCIE
jgi:hypothetical protein